MSILDFYDFCHVSPGVSQQALRINGIKSHEKMLLSTQIFLNDFSEKQDEPTETKTAGEILKSGFESLKPNTVPPIEKGPRCACGKEDLYETWLALNAIDKEAANVSDSPGENLAEKDTDNSEGSRKMEEDTIENPSRK